jgi:Undecaprenyl-phosphate glucose phosphotransferase
MNSGHGAMGAMAMQLEGALTQPLPRLADFGIASKAMRISPVLFTGFVRITEVALLSALGFLIAALYVPTVDLEASWQYMIAPVATSLVAAGVSQVLGLYTIPAFSTFLRHLPRVALAWLIALAVLVASVFFLKTGSEFSRVWLALWFAAGLVVLTALRAGVASMTRQGVADGRLVRRAVIYGGGAVCEQLLGALEADTESDIRICGVFDDRGDARIGRSVSGYPKLGTSDNLVEFGRNTQVDMLIMALPLVAESRLNGLINKLGVLPIDVRVAGNASSLKLARRSYSYIGSVPLLDVADKPINDWGNVAKWMFDKVVATLALIVLAPVMAIIALMIKCESRGPVLFRQKRYGFNNELVEVLKFRSMYTEQCDHAASRLVTRGDPRVTRIGRYLRKASIDELPQLFNVLSGTLSLVGPRPHAVQAKAADMLYPDVVSNYYARHKVKPGITGWAQINGWRGETDTEEKIQKRVEHDLYYIDNWSLLFDAYILAKTPIALLKTENAF